MWVWSMARTGKRPTGRADHSMPCSLLHAGGDESSGSDDSSEDYELRYREPRKEFMELAQPSTSPPTYLPAWRVEVNWCGGPWLSGMRRVM